MAQKIITITTDDITGAESKEAAEHTFSLDGVAYEIDLGPDSYDQLLEALSPYMKAGRKAGRIKSQGTKRLSKADGAKESAKIRAWAKDNGHTVNDRGRVPAPIRQAYEAAH